MKPQPFPKALIKHRLYLLLDSLFSVFEHLRLDVLVDDLVTRDALRKLGDEGSAVNDLVEPPGFRFFGRDRPLTLQPRVVPLQR